ncbi:MAG: class I SAM-dependent methyltransferase [Actinomycetota bacterium]|nr:class I SAM-dependent methyltransferase [Actinomycetota bacterium]
MPDGYREDLAYVHDAGFLSFAENAAPMLVEALRSGGLERGLVIDLCCGSGPLSRRLSDTGYDVLGVDISGAMVEMARKRVPGGRFVEGSILSLELQPCVAVAAVGECLNYLFDEGNTEEGLEDLLRRIHEALIPGGVLLFDAAGPGRAPGPGPSRIHAEGEDWAVLATAEEDGERGVLTRRITTFRKVGELYRRGEEVHHLRLIRREAIATQLRNLGFNVRILDSYGEMRFPPGLTGFLARKP